MLLLNQIFISMVGHKHVIFSFICLAVCISCRVGQGVSSIENTQQLTNLLGNFEIGIILILIKSLIIFIQRFQDRNLSEDVEIHGE